MRLENKIAIVTGASAGIGRATALLFAKEGATVIAAARRLEKLDDLVAEAAALAGLIIPCQTDVTKEADILALYAFALEKCGRIDIVINNAGMLDGLNALLTTDRELWDKVMLTNLTSTYLSCKRAVEIFMTQATGGNIVNMSSVAAVRGLGGGFAYTASKHGILGITRSVAAMYKDTMDEQHHIRCNTILPCNIESDMVKACYSFLSMETAKKIGSVGGQAPSGTADDIAYACLYLASDEARYVNGVALALDAGATAV